MRLLALMILFCWLSGCGFPAWRDQVLRDVAEGRWRVDPARVPSGDASSQIVELYDVGVRYVGYGKVQGGSVEIFNPDGSRTGFGRGR